MYRSLLSFVSFLTFTWASVKDDLLVAMKTELNHFDIPMPKNTLVSDIVTNHSYSLRTASTDTLVPVLKAWNLPADIEVQMEMAAYATSEQFQTYSFTYSLQHTIYEQYILSAKNVNDTITLAYMHVGITSNLVQQYETVHVHTCHRCWLVAKCCSSSTSMIKRGLTASELETVMIILQATAYTTYVANFPTELFLYYTRVKNYN
jgi:hypothetical protein